MEWKDLFIKKLMYYQLDQLPSGFIKESQSASSNERIAQTESSSGDAALQARLDNLRREWQFIFLP